MALSMVTTPLSMGSDFTPGPFALQILATLVSWWCLLVPTDFQLWFSLLGQLPWASLPVLLLSLFSSLKDCSI